MRYLAYYIGFVNITAFIACGIDKYKARHDKWRVRERTLFLLAAAGGSAGLLAGMKLFRHKTRHRSFTIGVPLILTLQIILVLYFLYRQGLLA